MSDFYVGQKVRVIQDTNIYKKGTILQVAAIDSSGYPSFAGETKSLHIGWAKAHAWTTPITTPEPEIEVTQVRIFGRLYNLVPVEK